MQRKYALVALTNILADFSVGPHSCQPGTFPCISKLNVVEIEDAKQIQEVVPVEN